MTSVYDALLIVSFGGPEGPDDVIPFLENVVRGKNVPHERLLQVAKHYEQFGGVSPINEHNRKLIAVLEETLREQGPNLPVYWGNRNWHPMLDKTIQRMADDGIQNALAFVTSAYSSYSSCRQYRENIEDARTSAGEKSPRIEKLRVFFNHPGFIEANADRLQAALDRFDESERRQCKIVFTAHSIPVSMAEGCDYEKQLREASRLVAESVGHDDWGLAFQSRSGPATVPWLVPDVSDYLKELGANGCKNVVVQPIGFICDHLEVMFDLDKEATRTAEELGVKMIRAGTAGTHPALISMIRDLILEKMEGTEPKSVGIFGAVDCTPTCCRQSAL